MAEFKYVNAEPLTNLFTLSSESKNVVLINTFFDIQDKLHPSPPLNHQLSDQSRALISECVRVLKFGGLFFVYGLPKHLAIWGEYISKLDNSRGQMLFKYWITLDIEDAGRTDTLAPTSMGLLMFLKSKPTSKTPTPFHLNTSTARSPHVYCTACGQNLKDWGGKKHLMHPSGTSLSDVWRDLPKVRLQSHLIPDYVLKRVKALTEREGDSHLLVVQNEQGITTSSAVDAQTLNSDSSSSEWEELTDLELNKVYQGDCISFLNRVASLHPEGVFDLAFADPPYNLKKTYDMYDDALAEQKYIEWCNRWLEGMARTLKPGGSLFVLNLPKWAIHHAAFLHSRLEFRHWITWDALSDPRGKLMPAHYALLYYTKPGTAPIFNYSAEGGQAVHPPDSPQYCLRASCVRRRKRLGDDEKVELSDIWFDVHRIKHKRDRDAHPCQLPEKLMERIISLTTDTGGLIFDPFCGAGTTALAARKLDRNFVTLDLDPNYVRITREKLAAMERHTDLFGISKMPRHSIKKSRTAASKKEIETYLQRLAQRLGKEPSEKDIEADNAEMLRKIDLIYPTRLAAIKKCRVVLRA